MEKIYEEISQLIGTNIKAEFDPVTEKSFESVKLFINSLKGTLKDKFVEPDSWCPSFKGDIWLSWVRDKHDFIVDIYPNALEKVMVASNIYIDDDMEHPKLESSNNLWLKSYTFIPTNVVEWYERTIKFPKKEKED